MKYNLEQLKDLCLQGITKREISRIIGTGPQYITKLIKKYNLEYTEPIKYKDITGKRFTKLVAIKFDGFDRHNKAKWLCKCDCGNIKSINHCSLNRKLTKSCGCISIYKKRIKSYEDIPYQWFRRLKEQAISRNYNFDITIKDIWNQYVKQNKKCYYTDLDINFSNNMANQPQLATASVDRIDSNKNYTINNIVICHKIVNLSKNFLNREEFIKICNLVAYKHKENYENCVDYGFRTILRKI